MINVLRRNALDKMLFNVSSQIFHTYLGRKQVQQHDNRYRNEGGLTLRDNNIIICTEMREV
jgi:hypothetical protein